MAFQGISFTFNGVSGDTYDLCIADTKSGGETSTSLGANYSIVEDRTNLSKNYLFGMIEEGVLEFPLSIMCLKEMSRQDISIISRWLFNQNKYGKLQILQEDLANVYYNCKLNSPELVSISNNLIGFRCDVICDSAYAHEFPRKISKNMPPNNVLNMVYNNECDSNDNMNPLTSLYSSKANGTISIKNKTSGKETIINKLLEGEIIELDSKLKIIKSNKSDYNYDRFNGVFPCFSPNLNQLEIKGDISKIEFTTENLRRVGG